MGRPLFLEGEAGVGKTALARALAEVRRRRADPAAVLRGARRRAGALRLGLPPPAAAPARRRGGRRGRRRGELERDLYDRRFLRRAPAAAGDRDRAGRAARRRGRPGRRRVRGVPARGAQRLHDHGPGAGHGPRRATRRWSCSPATAPARSTTRSSAAASTTGSTTRVEREVAIIRRRLPEATEQLAGDVAARDRSAARRQDLLKPPGVAESLDWTEALLALGARSLDPDRAAAHARRGAEVPRGHRAGRVPAGAWPSAGCR